MFDSAHRLEVLERFAALEARVSSALQLVRGSLMIDPDAPCSADLLDAYQALDEAYRLAGGVRAALPTTPQGAPLAKLCRDCREPIVFLPHVTTGKRVPIDAARAAGLTEYDPRAGVPSHFTTCAAVRSRETTQSESASDGKPLGEALFFDPT